MKNFADILVQEDKSRKNYADVLYAEDNIGDFQKTIQGLNGSTDVNAYKSALNELSRYKGFIDDKSYNQLSDYLSSSIKQIPLNNFSENYKSWANEINSTTDTETIKKRTAELAKQLETIKNDISYDDYIAFRDEFVNTQTRARKRSEAVNGFKTSVDNALMSDSVTAKDLLELQQAQQNGTGLADNETIDKVKKHLLGQSTGDYKTDNMVFLKTLRDTAEESGNQKDVEVYDKAIELKQLEIDKGNAKQLSKYLETPLFERQLKEFDNAFTENKTGVTNFKYSASDEFKKDFGEVVVPYFKMQEIRSKIKNGDTLTETELKWALSGYCDNSYFDSETILTKDDYYNMHKNHQKIFNENKSLQFSFDNYITTINDTKAYGNNSLIIAEAYAKSESAGLELKALAADDFDKYANLGSNDEATEFMTATQKGVYNYYLSKGDTQSAYAYKRGIQEDINYKEAKELAENEGFFTKTGVSYAAGLEKFGEGLIGFVEMMSDNGIGIKTPQSHELKIALATDSVLSLATAEIIAGSGTWGKVWYSSMQSLGQQTPMIALSLANPAMGLSGSAMQLLQGSMMFVSSSGASYIDALKENKAENEAAVYAAINGALEVGLEKALGSMYGWSGGSKVATKLLGEMQDALMSKGLSKVTMALLGVVTYKLSGMASEGFEEYLQEVIDPIVRNFVYNEDNDISLFSEEAFISFASGALVSFLFGATNIKSTYRQSLAGASIRSNTDGINGLVENAHNALNNPEIIVEIKQEISALLETIESKGNQATNIELGQLQELVQTGINQASAKQVEQAFNDLKNDIADAKEMIQNAPDLSETASIDEELQSNLINGTDTTTPGEVSNSDIETKAPNNSTGVSETDSADVDFDTNIDADINTEVNVESSNDIDATAESEIAEADYLDNETLESVEENEYDKTIRLMDGRAKPLTEAQAYVQSVGRALGYNVVIDDLSRGGRTASGKSFKATTRGFFDGQTIYLHEGQTTFDAVVEIFKHEITHYSELNPEMYEKYANAVFNSKVFEKWISGKAKGRSHSVRVGNYRQSIIDNYAEHGKMLDPTAADREIIANFTSEMLFNEKGNTLERFISEVNSENRNVISQFIHDFISWLKARLKGEKVSLKIVKLENRFAAVLRNVDNANAQKNNTTNDGDVQYLFAGQKSRTSNYSLLDQAIKLEDVGKATSEEIRQQTGWFRGYDGKWRYEISDRDIEVDTTGKFHTNPDIRRQTELFNKVYFDATATEAEIKELQVLNKNLKGVIAAPQKLGQLIKHTKLFDAYPWLKDVNIRFEFISERGAYNPVFNEIVLSNHIKLNKEQLTKTLIHEIQHAIQYYEAFASGSNTEYWRDLGIDENELFKYYENTAGEIEARDAASRWWRSDEARKDVRPDIDRTDVVFADEEIVSFDYMSKESLENNVNDILSMGDEVAKKRKSNGQYISVLSNTPKVIIDNVTDAQDREIIMRFDALYLAVRHDGALEGHYHNFGKNFSEIITNVLNSPDAIIIMDNGRLNLLATIKSSKGNYTVVSVEMNSVKDINNENKAYNVVVSMLPAKDNYIRNLIENRAKSVKYKKEDLLQVNPQLYKWLSAVNKKSSDTTVPQKAQSVNTHYTQESKNNSSPEQDNDGNSYSFGDIDKDKSKKYNKAIKVPNVAYRIISSRRTERYANLDDTDIPLTDIVTIGERRLNTTIQYFIRNNSRSDFVIYKKRKSSPKKGTLEYDINDEIDRAIARHSGLERDNQQNGAQNNSLVPSKRRGTEIRNKRSEENQQPNDRRHNNDTSEASRRRRQLEIIQNTNPAYVDYLTWIRSVEDIHTLQETLEMSDWAPYDEFDPDYSKQDALNAIKNGKIKVYSSHPIGQGVFVTPSKMEAQTYAGDGTVYEQVVNIDDIAWIDPTQGQYAKVEAGLDDSAFSMPENDGIQYSFEDDVVDKTSSLAERVRLGEISQTEYLNELQQLMDEATEKFGAIPKGENPKVDVTVPKQVSDKRNTRRFVRTVLESGILTDEMVADTDEAILKDALSYVPISNEEAIKVASKSLKNGTAERDWNKVANGDKIPSKHDIAKGEMLLKMYAENGDTLKVMELVADLSEVATRAGQSVQTFSLLKKMSGVGKLYYIQKTVDKLNRDLEKKHKGKHEQITIDETLAGQLVTAKPGTEAENIADEIMQDIAEQVPVTFLDKWNAWRYLAMLGNPRTHIRNLLGNAVFMPAIKLKDTIKAGMEKAFVSQENRTTSVIVNKEYKEFAESDFEKVVDIITGNGKMNPSDTIREQQKIFKNKVLEGFRKFNFDMLEKEDMIFLKMHYKRALGGFLQARNVDLNNIDETLLNEARNYAIEEAQKATYRDMSALANTVSRFSRSNKTANLLIEGILPFKKTPINIVKRGIEYSPVGLLKTLSKGSYELAKGNITVSQYIDGISSGLTGTGVFVLGVILSNLGIAIGGLGYDDEDALKRLNGEQGYSIELFGKSYTVDWMAPVCIPFFMGVEFANTFADNEKDIVTAFVDAAYSSLEPVINLSMLSGIRDTIAAARYSDAEDVLTQIGGETITSYFSQALPTLFGQVARTLDDTRRSNFVPGDATGFEKKLYEFTQNAMSKIPILENQKMPYTDAFGEKDTNDNFFFRLFENMLSPGYSSTIKETDVNAELADLFGQTGDSAVIPQKAPKSFNVNGERIYLNADEYTQYNTKKGQLSQNMLVDLFNSKGYKSMTYTKKAEAVSEVYKYANMLAKTEVSDYQLEGKYAKWKEYQGYGYDVSELIALDITDKDLDGSGGVSKSEYAEAVNNTDMNQKQKDLLIGLNDVEGKSDYSKSKTKGFGAGDWYYKKNGQYIKITSAAELNQLRRNNVDTYVYTGNYTDEIDELWKAYRGY